MGLLTKDTPTMALPLHCTLLLFLICPPYGGLELSHFSLIIRLTWGNDNNAIISS